MYYENFSSVDNIHYILPLEKVMELAHLQAVYLHIFEVYQLITDKMQNSFYLITENFD